MKQEIIDAARAAKGGLELAALLAFIEVETGGRAFDPNTGKIMIQFEPAWFRKFAPNAPRTAWASNRIEVQSGEWKAFNDAFRINREAAMKSTSIGLGQIMGFHYERLGYGDVGSMWDDAKKGIDRQVAQIVKFILTDARLYSAVRGHNWERVATIYNGSGYKALAARTGRTPYDVSMARAYSKYHSEFPKE